MFLGVPIMRQAMESFDAWGDDTPLAAIMATNGLPGLPIIASHWILKGYNPTLVAIDL